MTSLSPLKPKAILGGIAGPAVAIFLKRAGIEAEIYETRTTAGAYSLSLSSNGVTVLKMLSLDGAAKFLSLVLTSVMLLVACSSQAATTQSDLQTQEADAIKKVIAGIDAAWNQGDAIAFASHWAEDGTEINPMGEIREGRAEIEKNIAVEFAGPLKGTTHKLTATKIYLLKPDVAVVDGEAEIFPVSDPSSEPVPPWTASFTAIFVKDQRGQWVVSHIRSYTFLP